MSKVSRAFVVSVLSLGFACGGDDGGETDAAPTADGNPTISGWEAAPALPTAIANNAVAGVETASGCSVFSVLGIGGALGQADISSASFRFDEGGSAWQTIPAAPGPARVAASAVGLRGNLWVLGGYEVAPNGAETSGDRLDMFNLTAGAWEPKATIPTPIDDTIAVAWLDRYIITVSGWSNTANVAAVQIYDADNDMWAAGTAFPGTAAFGHAGALVGNSIYVIDGAASTSGFPLVSQAWRGDLDPGNPTVITWTDLGSHPGPNRYRAAGGTVAGAAWFHGGTATPYNFDGLRYDNNQPAEPIDSTLVFEPAASLAAELKPTATMDHRSLGMCGDRVYSVGGLIAGPAATTEVWVTEVSR